MTVVRVATYNVHGGLRPGAGWDPAPALRLLARIDADVVALQEVRAPRLAAQPAAFLELEERTDLTVVPGPTLLRDGEDYGNAVLTRLEVESVRRHRIDEPGREPRGLLDVGLRGPRGPLRVLATHLGLARSERRRQAEAIVAVIGARGSTPLVVAGDFNDWLPWSASLRTLRGRLGRPTSVSTWPSRWPAVALDRIWAADGARIVRAHAIRSDGAARVSDHLPLVASIEITGGSP